MNRRRKVAVELEHFYEDEFGPDLDRMNPALLLRLELLRQLVGEPIYVTSAWRADGTGAHPEGDAVDVADNNKSLSLSSRWRHKVLKYAYLLGFKRIGVYDKHIHLDVDLERDQEVTWWGRSV